VFVVAPPRPNGREEWSFGSGNGRVDPVEPLTLIEGTVGVTEMDGALMVGPRAGAGAALTEMDGISGVTEIEGTLPPRPLFGAGD